MEEIIKPNDYVRTHNGRIYKVTNVYILKITCGHTVLRYNDIKSCSSNIIDLIEVGDYVNGYKVSFKDNDGRPFVQCDYPVEAGTTNHYRFYEETIKSIVTQEQFESIKYRLE